MDLIEREWQGDTPVCLLIVGELGQQVVLDLDEPQWVDKNKPLLDAQGTWHLLTKDGSYLFTQVIGPGERGWCVKRRIGRGLLNVEIEARTSAYGFGKVRHDGTKQSIWWFDGGQICAGDDVYEIATAKNAAKLEEMVLAHAHATALQVNAEVQEAPT